MTIVNLIVEITTQNDCHAIRNLCPELICLQCVLSLFLIVSADVKPHASTIFCIEVLRRRCGTAQTPSIGGVVKLAFFIGSVCNEVILCLGIQSYNISLTSFESSIVDNFHDTLTVSFHWNSHDSLDDCNGRSRVFFSISRSFFLFSWFTVRALAVLAGAVFTLSATFACTTSCAGCFFLTGFCDFFILFAVVPCYTCCVINGLHTFQSGGVGHIDIVGGVSL